MINYCSEIMFSELRRSQQSSGGGSEEEERAVLPSLEHLTSQHFQHVYEPAEDTYLLCDALLRERQELVASKPRCCVEVGCGSGCVITYLGQLLTREQHKSFMLIGTDINPHALQSTRETAAKNQMQIEVVRSSLLSGLENGLRGKIDVMLFNPPYVPTPDEEVHGSDIESSWAGGKDGRRVIDRLLPKIKDLLSESGRLYMILVKENKPKEISRICSANGLQTEVVLSRQAANERLLVMKIMHAS